MSVHYEPIEDLAHAAARAVDFSGTTAVVTGGAGILGRGFATSLAAHGASVMIGDIDLPRAQAVAGEISALGKGAVAAEETDVRDPSALDRLFDRAAERFGPVTAVINNHTAPRGDDISAMFAPFHEYAPQEWRRQMEVTLDGAFFTAQAAIRHFLSHGRPSAMLMMSSIYGIRGADKRIYEGSNYHGAAINTPPPYSAAKAGVVGLTRYLATEYADRGIRVNALAPGGVFSGQNDAFQAAYGARAPMGRMARQNEMFGAALYLLGPSASYLTGQVLAVDGGLSAW